MKKHCVVYIYMVIYVCKARVKLLEMWPKCTIFEKTNTCCLLALCAILDDVCLQDSVPGFSVEILRRKRLELVIVQDE